MPAASLQTAGPTGDMSEEHDSLLLVGGLESLPEELEGRLPLLDNPRF